MKCSAPSQNTKIIARAINSLAKIGDEIYLECSPDVLVLRAINSGQSAFAEFSMQRSFFLSYHFQAGDEPASFKVTARSFLVAFRNPHLADKQIESCDISVRPERNLIVFQIKYANRVVRKYVLPVIEHERLEATVPVGLTNRLTVSSKFLSSAVRNFRLTEDEVTLTVESERTVLKNHAEVRSGEPFMRTELCFHPSEFEEYSVAAASSITFCFNELRAVLALAEPSSLPVAASFTGSGQPIVFRLAHPPVHEAVYVVSTLNSSGPSASAPTSLLSSSLSAPGAGRSAPTDDVLSSYGSSSEIFNNVSSLSLPTDHLPSPAVPNRLMKVVFARCFHPNPSTNNPTLVLAPDSDGEPI